MGELETDHWRGLRQLGALKPRHAVGRPLPDGPAAGACAHAALATAATGGRALTLPGPGELHECPTCLAQEHLLLLLDGIAGGVRRCMRRTYSVRVPPGPSLPSSPTAAGNSAGASQRHLRQPVGAPTHPRAAPAGITHAGPGPAASLLPVAGSQLLDPGMPAGATSAAVATPGFAALGGPLLLSRGTTPGSPGATADLAPPVKLQLPQLHQAHMQAVLPAEHEMAAWQQVGDICCPAT